MNNDSFDRLINEIRTKDSVINEVKEELARANVAELTTTGGIKYLSRRSALLGNVKELVMKAHERPKEANEILNEIFNLLKNED